MSYRLEVQPVLAKSGCNAGTCHGNLNGKGGFRLSLRGDDPAADLVALTREHGGRRIDALDPSASLLLAKATLAIAHQGGRRFAAGSREHQLVMRWIAQGAADDVLPAPTPVELVVEPAGPLVIPPGGAVALSVAARFDDGTTRDVTHLAVAEASGPAVEIAAPLSVRGAGRGEATVLVRYLREMIPLSVAVLATGGEPAAPPRPARHPIDRLVFSKLNRLRLPAAPAADDSALVRRVHLDLLGVLPSADAARAYVADRDPEKYGRLIEVLLVRPEFAEHWARKWCDLLHVEEKTLDRKGVQAIHHWLARQMDDGRPWNEMAAELLSARGSTYHVPAANFYRALRDPTERSEAAAQIFLGVRLQCARCHNHPFDRWTQDDYYAWGALFARVDYKILENARRDTNDKHEFDGEQIVFDGRGTLRHPRTGKPARPRLLGAEAELAADSDPLAAVAQWVAGDAQGRFSRAQANRIWYHLLGRGLVEPVDDLRPTNPASHPELLDHLADQFRREGFDLRRLVRAIVLSETYRMAATAAAADPLAAANFATALPRRLSAEVLLDAQTQVLGATVRFNGYPEGIRAGQLPGVEAVRSRDRPPSPADRFLAIFGKPPRLLSCECERSEETTLAQAFALINGQALEGLIADPQNRLAGLASAELSDAEAIDELYWAALSRPPAPAEREALLARLAAVDRRTALEDLAWALVTSPEFVFRP